MITQQEKDKKSKKGLFCLATKTYNYLPKEHFFRRTQCIL